MVVFPDQAQHFLQQPSLQDALFQALAEQLEKDARTDKDKDKDKDKDNDKEKDKDRGVGDGICGVKGEEEEDGDGEDVGEDVGARQAVSVTVTGRVERVLAQARIPLIKSVYTVTRKESKSKDKESREYEYKELSLCVDISLDGPRNSAISSAAMVQTLVEALPPLAPVVVLLKRFLVEKVRENTCVYIHTCKHKYTYIHAQHTHTYTHTHIHTYTHAHMHTQTQALNNPHHGGLSAHGLLILVLIPLLRMARSSATLAESSVSVSKSTSAPGTSTPVSGPTASTASAGNNGNTSNRSNTGNNKPSLHLLPESPTRQQQQHAYAATHVHNSRGPLSPYRRWEGVTRRRGSSFDIYSSINSINNSQSLIGTHLNNFHAYSANPNKSLSDPHTHGPGTDLVDIIEHVLGVSSSLEQQTQQHQCSHSYSYVQANGQRAYGKRVATKLLKEVGLGDHAHAAYDSAQGRVRSSSSGSSSSMGNELDTISLSLSSSINISTESDSLRWADGGKSPTYGLVIEQFLRFYSDSELKRGEGEREGEGEGEREREGGRGGEIDKCGKERDGREKDKEGKEGEEDKEGKEENKGKEDTQWRRHGFSLRDGGFRFFIPQNYNSPATATATTGGKSNGTSTSTSSPHPLPQFHPHPHADDPLIIEDPLDAVNNVGRLCYKAGAIQKNFSECLERLRRLAVRWNPNPIRPAAATLSTTTTTTTTGSGNNSSSSSSNNSSSSISGNSNSATVAAVAIAEALVPLPLEIQGGANAQNNSNSNNNNNNNNTQKPLQRGLLSEVFDFP